MRRLTILMASLTLALLAPLFASGAEAAPGAKAEAHPDHVQQEIGDGPAEEDNGMDRGNPAGNNGTIKIDGRDLFNEFDGHPQNEPHIGCIFEVDVYGVDEGDSAVLEFREWDPTLHQEPILTVDLTDTPGDDGAAGGIDIDEERLVDLGPWLMGEPHPQHGHHVRVDAMITSGDDVYRKVKVFWTGICAGTGYPGGSGS